MAKGYNTTFCIGCTRRINDRSRGFIADGHPIGHSHRGLVAGRHSAGSPCTGAAASDAYGIVSLDSGRIAAYGYGAYPIIGNGLEASAAYSFLLASRRGSPFLSTATLPVILPVPPITTESAPKALLPLPPLTVANWPPA